MSLSTLSSMASRASARRALPARSFSSAEMEEPGVVALVGLAEELAEAWHRPPSVQQSLQAPVVSMPRSSQMRRKMMRSMVTGRRSSARAGVSAGCAGRCCARARRATVLDLREEGVVDLGRAGFLGVVGLRVLVEGALEDRVLARRPRRSRPSGVILARRSRRAFARSMACRCLSA